MNKRWLPLLSLATLVTLIARTGCDITSRLASYEVTIPKKLEPKDGREIEGYMSYTIKVEGRTHIVHLKQNRASLSPNFTVFIYTDEGEILAQQPYIRNDCYYQGVVEGIKDSIVALSTCSGLRGFLQTRTLNYGIQPVDSSSSFQHLVYRMKDADTEISMCGVKSHGMPINLNGFESTKYRANPVIQATKRYVEMVLVVDYEYTHSQNITKVQKDMIEIINQVDAIYNQLNTDVVLVGVEIWTKESLINVDSGSHKVLGDFSTWRDEHLRKRLPSDMAILVLKRKFGNTIGLAYVGKICSKYLSVAFVSCMQALEQCTVTVAHELGHTLLMEHDTEKCACPTDTGCIMKPNLRTATTFSQCSVNYYTDLIQKGGAGCLLNIPAPSSIFTLQLCGNKVLDEDEQCDCGSVKECQNDPCCNFNCKLKKGVECTSGRCCKNCKFIKKGNPCRVPVSECDLAEYCNGASETCPPDLYVQDGTPCNKDQSVCYEKRCYDSNRHCRTMFGKGAKGAPLECYIALNSIGDKYGNCGRGRDGQWIKCGTKDAKCGRVKCTNVKQIHAPDSYTAIIQDSTGEYTCWGMDYDEHRSLTDIGDTPEGARCAEGQVCIKKKCSQESNLGYDCDTEKKCNRRGVCNNKKNCHCNKGWAPPNCIKSGFGGSVDSGPLVKGSFVSYVYLPEEEKDNADEISKLKENQAIRRPRGSLAPLAIVLAIIIPIITASIIAYMARNAIRGYFEELKEDMAEAEGSETSKISTKSEESEKSTDEYKEPEKNESSEESESTKSSKVSEESIESEN